MSCVRDGGCARVGGVRREEVGGPHFGRGDRRGKFPAAYVPDRPRARRPEIGTWRHSCVYRGRFASSRRSDSHRGAREGSVATMMVQPPSFETLVLEVDRAAHVGVVRLNRPRKSNAIDASMWDEIPRAMRWMDEDEDVRVVVLCAAGKNFCAGIDVSTPESLSGQLGQSAAMKGDCPGRKAEALYRCALARAPSPTSRDPTSAPVPFNNDPSRLAPTLLTLTRTSLFPALSSSS